MTKEEALLWYNSSAAIPSVFVGSMLLGITLQTFIAIKRNW